MGHSNTAGSITALTVQQRNQDRVNVFIDGQFAFGLSASVAHELSVGQILTTEQAEKLQQLDAAESAKMAAVRLISRRPRSVAEIRRSLLGKDYDELVVDWVVEKLASLDLLDDEAFSHYWVEQRETFKPRSHFDRQSSLRHR
jgi:regulatory protein